MADSSLRLLAISVGNSRTSFGHFDGRGPRWVRSIPNAEPERTAEAIAEGAELAATDPDRAVVVLASVNPAFTDPMARVLEGRLKGGIYVIGRDLAVPIRHTLDPETLVGQDRLLAALAAFDAVGQACVVVDAGTALTVDFVDGVGVFQGGAIAPGPRMMLRSLHAGAAQLPEVDLTRPDESAVFGKSTAQAKLNGVLYGIRGMVRMLAERYAESYGAYPRIVATGGDARFLFEGDELIETIIDDLVLKGIAITCETALREA